MKLAKSTTDSSDASNLGAIDSISFSGCSWLMTYHLGVCEAIRCELSDSDSNGNNFTYWGASSGSVSALLMVAKVSTKDSLQYCLDLAAKSRKSRVGPFGKMTQYVSGGLMELLPDLNAIDVKRLKVSVTKIRGLKNQVLPDRPPEHIHELVNVIMASCYIPLYYEKPVFIKNHAYCDGGVTNNTPFCDRQKTIIVSPKPSLQKETIDIYPKNEPPFKRAVFPCSQLLVDLYDQGKGDATAYFRTLKYQTS